MSELVTISLEEYKRLINREKSLECEIETLKSAKEGKTDVPGSVCPDASSEVGTEDVVMDRFSTLQGIIESTNAMVFSIDTAYRYTSFNQGHAAIMKALYGAEIAVGCNMLEYFTVDADRDVAKRNLDRALAGEHLVEEAYSGEELRSRLYFRVSHSPIKNAHGDVVGAVMLAQEMSERRHNELIMQARLRLLEFAQSHSMDELLAASLDEMEALTNSTIGFYHFLEEDQTTISLQNWSTNTVKHMCTALGKGTHYDIAEAGVWVDCIRERRPVVHNDYASLPHRRGLPEGHAPIIREVVVPIFRGPLIRAIIGVGNKATEYTANDIEMVAELGDLSLDITTRKRDEEELVRLNRELRAISNCNQQLMRASDEDALLREICRIICEEAGYRFAWVGYVEHDVGRTVRPVAWDGFEDGYLTDTRITWADTERGRGPTGSAVRLGAMICVQDFATDPMVAPWREGALKRGYRSSIALPLRDDVGDVFGVLCMYSATANIFTDSEIRLIEELSGDLAYGITVLRTRKRHREAVDALRESELKFRSLYEESFDGLFVTSPDGRILDMNRKGIEIFGYDTKDEIMALDLERDVYADPLDRKRILEMVDRNGTAEYEIVVRKKSGLLMDAYCSLSAKRDDAGVVVEYRGIIRDITEEKRAKEEIRKLNLELELRVARRTEELEMANKELEAFSYSVSHDLRAPLRHINGFVEKLQNSAGDRLDAQGEHYLTVISDTARQMGALIDDLLSFSKMGRAAMSRTDVDFRQLALEVIQEFNMELRDREVKWHIANLPGIKGDRAMLRVVLVNLVSNAIKFSARNPLAEIEIGWLPGGPTEATFFVRDNGVGFDMRFAHKLFGVFQRLHHQDEFEGTGIGLANVQRIINRHGGRVWAESASGQGATFYFTLPRSPGN